MDLRAGNREPEGGHWTLATQAFQVRWGPALQHLYLPINRGGNPLFCCQLERDNNSENLVKVPAGGRGVEEGQLQFLIRAKNKHL